MSLMRSIRRVSGIVGLCAAMPLFGASLRVGTFVADATPDMGEPNIWITPVTKVETPLLVKGIVIDDGRGRYVIAALDWCGVGGSTHLLFRTKAAKAAGTDVSRVMVQSVHQHAAPYIVGDGYDVMAKHPTPPLRMSEAYLERVTDRLAEAVRKAAANMQPFDSVGTSQADVERVASARRVYKDGKLVSRVSTAGKDPAMAAIPEGDIDPALRTITLAQGKKPLVRMHFYATHPQTFCCEGTASADIIGDAREKREAEEKAFQIYFTGCSGDVTVGKYNDTSREAREGLAVRLERAMKASSDGTKFAPAGKLAWRNAPLVLERKPAPSIEGTKGQEVYRQSIAAAFAARTRPLDTASLELGGATMLFLPGEPVLEFQKYALANRGNRFVAVAGYGDIAPGYLVTDSDYKEGGYEPSASHAQPGTEARLKEVIRKLLGR